MKSLCSLALVVLGTFALVDGHAKLVEPIAWNSQPSKTNPCGGGKGTLTATNWKVGSANVLKWTIVAGDGNGPITVTLDKTGGTNFAAGTVLTAVEDPTSTPPVNMQKVGGPYSFLVTVPPGTTCTGGTDQRCTVQVKSSTNWYACASITIGATTSTPKPTPKATTPTPKPTPGPAGATPTPDASAGAGLESSCEVAKDLTFCPEANGKNIFRGNYPDLSIADSLAMDTFNNRTVILFNNKDNPQCQQYYRKLLCATYLPLCSDDGRPYTCKPNCKATLAACEVTESHKALYPCDEYPDTNEDSVGSCEFSAASISSIFSLPLLVAAMLIAGIARGF